VFGLDRFHCNSIFQQTLSKMNTLSIIFVVSNIQIQFIMILGLPTKLDFRITQGFRLSQDLIGS